MTGPKQPSADEFVNMSVGDRRQYLDGGGVPPQLSQEQMQALPQSQLESYYRNSMGANAPGIGGIIPGAVAMAQTASTEGQRWKQANSGDVEYVQGLNGSDHDYLGEDHAAMRQYLDAAEVQQIADTSDGYHEFHRAFQDFAEEMKAGIDGSQSEWEGDAAENARSYFTGLQKWSDASSQNAYLASQTMYQQSEAASSAKNNMPEEVPFNWDSEMKRWGDNPFNIVGNIDKSIEQYKQHNEAHEQAAQVMKQYDGDLFQAASKQPVFAEPPKFNANGGGDGGNDRSAGQINVPGGDTTNPSSVSPGNVGGSSVNPGGGSYTAPTGPSGNNSVTAPPPLAPGAVTGNTPGSTAPSNYQPPGYQSPNFNRGSNSNRNSQGGFGPMPMGGMGGAGGAGGGSEYSSKLGRGAGGMGSGFGPGGSSSGGAPGAGAASGAAKGMGAAGGAPGGGAAGAASGAAGGRGAAGMGGMGGGRGGGKGEDDQEHQRPTYLVEGDPDDVFGTDERTAPPVIGE